MHFADRLGHWLRRHRANRRLGEGPIEAEIDLGDPRNRGEALLVFRTVDAEGADVVERALLEPEKVLAVDELAVLGIFSDVCDESPHKSQAASPRSCPCRRRLRYSFEAMPETYPQVPDAMVQRVDDRLTVGDDLVDAVVEVENPVQGLLWRGDVVAPRAEDDDWRLDVSEVDPDPVRRADLPGRELVADEQIVDDPLDFAAV